MSKKYIEEQVFTNVNFQDQQLVIAEYENCVFKSCQFTGIYLHGIIFSECKFEDCELSTCELSGAAIRDCAFQSCKMLGLRFDECNQLLFSASFDQCLLNFSSFYKTSLKGGQISRSQLHEVDFTEANLAGISFDGSDLKGAIFENTSLEKADFRSAENYQINPEMNRIKKARFSQSGIIGLLSHLDIQIH